MEEKNDKDKLKALIKNMEEEYFKFKTKERKLIEKIKNVKKYFPLKAVNFK